MKRAAVIVAWAGVWLVGCSSDVDQGRRCADDRALCSAPSAPSGSGGAGMDMGTGTGGNGTAGSKGVVGSDSELSVRVQDIQKMTIEIITLACAGDCADIEAVAHGGNPPYAFAWEDGSTSAPRRVCLDANTTLRVSATDTAIIDDEFSYAAHTVSTDVIASVLDCTDAGVPPATGDFCIENPSLEGATGTAEMGWDLPGWSTCYLTPNVEPFGIFSTIPARDGDTYIGFQDAIQDTLNESAGVAFCAPLAPGRAVSFSVDIGLSAFNMGSAQLELWGGLTSCSKEELLWTSPVVADLDTWQTFCGTLTPSKSYGYLTLWPVLASPEQTAAYVIVDDFRPVSSCN